MSTEPTRTDETAEQQRRREAPTVAECLEDQHVPIQYRKQAERAFAFWLASWHGLDETAESLSRSVSVS